MVAYLIELLQDIVPEGSYFLCKYFDETQQFSQN